MCPTAIVPSEDQKVEVTAKSKRRNFAVGCKLGILGEAGRCGATGRWEPCCAKRGFVGRSSQPCQHRTRLSSFAGQECPLLRGLVHGRWVTFAVSAVS